MPDTALPDDEARKAPLPQRGRRPPSLSHEDTFGKVFDGNVVKRFSAFLRPYRRRIYWAIFAVIVFTLTQLSVPLIIRHIVDGALLAGAEAERLLLIAVGGFFAVSFINYVSNYWQTIIVAKIAEYILHDLRAAMYGHLQKVSLSFMDRTQVGRLMSRLQGDVGSLQEFLESSIFAIGDIVLLFGIIFVLLALDVQLGLLTLSVLPILAVLRAVWQPIARRAFSYARATNSIVNSALAENINGVRTVQEMVRQGVNFADFEEKARENYNAHMRATKIANVMIPTVDTLTGLAMAIVIVVGGNQVLGKSLDLGVMVAFLFYVQRFFDPIRSLTQQYTVSQRAMASGTRIFEVLDVPIDVMDKPHAEILDKIDGSIEFRNVTFGYVEGLPVLKNVSFRVAPGETVALVGPTGSGKTSTMSLLHRFYDVWDGQILIGGHDVRDVTQESLGCHIAMVLQEPFLFTGTVLENIRYHCEDATREQVIDAAKAVGAHAFIEKLSDGYDTVLGQRGVNLSIGQRQLLSFARAIVADAGILVLDEATANIDSFTEREIQTALARTLKGRTGVVIAHRLATVRNADRIIVLQDGRIVEQGNHAELIARHGLYHRLHTMNYASFDDAPEDLVRANPASGT